MSTAVEQIKDKLNIVDVLSSYIKVEKAGINWKARCPFHNEKTPSFFISSSRQSFYCFGCGEKGDIFTFIEKFEGLDFRGALETLAERAGIELPKFKRVSEEEETRETKEKETYFKIIEEATQMYESELKENKEALSYLLGRGLSRESISKWRIGFARDEWRSLHDHLLGKGYSKENLLDAGLIKKTPDADKYYDTFRNRIMFPISDSTNRVIAFSGRAMREDDKNPKYLNSPETKIFYKSEVLYGFNIAKNYIRKLDYAVLVEGQMDLTMSHQAGVSNTVASSGTALTELHLKKIQKLTNRIIVAYDSDSSGEKAALRAAELGLSIGMEVKIASLPEGEDPASIIRGEGGVEKWKTALRESANLLDFALEKAIKNKSGRELTKEVLKSVLPLVSLVKSEIEKSQFVKKLAIKMRVGEQAVWDDLKKIKINDINIPAEETPYDYRKEKEALIFEAERYGFKMDIEKINEETLARVKRNDLKRRLQELAILLDDKDLSKEEREEAETNFRQTQTEIKELEKN